MSELAVKSSGILEVEESELRDTIACILPIGMSPDDHVRDLESRIMNMQAELDLMRRRDLHLNGFMQKLDEEQRLAARLQQDFLPKRLPEVGPVRFHTLYRPASYVSGDMYDIMRIDETTVGFYVADAVGHGIPAALLTMFMKNALVTKDISGGSYRVLEPSQTIAKLNNTIVDQNLSNATFATAVYGTIDTSTLKMDFSRGGHPNPIVLRGDRMIELESDGALLGIFAEEMFSNCSFQLEHGDRVFIYTDGVEVAFSNPDSPDPERWKHELFARRGLSVPEILNEFALQLETSEGSALPKDDLTMVGIEIRKSA